MVWLTRVRVSVIEAAKLRLADSYAWHQVLWHAFPGRDGCARDFLTRVDRCDGCYEALILSPVRPGPQPWGRWESKEVAPAFLEHSRYRFSLRANPTVKRVVRDESGQRKKNGRRTGIFSPDELETWLKTKGEAAGFRIETMSCDPPVRESFCRQGRQGTHLRVDFRGTLAVDDRQRFQAAFQQGIGPARAFGFGLLLLQPIA